MKDVPNIQPLQTTAMVSDFTQQDFYNKELALLFPSIREICNPNFQKFCTLLSSNNVTAGSLKEEVQKEITYLQDLTKKSETAKMQCSPDFLSAAGKYLSSEGNNSLKFDNDGKITHFLAPGKDGKEVRCDLDAFTDKLKIMIEALEEFSKGTGKEVIVGRIKEKLEKKQTIVKDALYDADWHRNLVLTEKDSKVDYWGQPPQERKKDDGKVLPEQQKWHQKLPNLVHIVMQQGLQNGFLYAALENLYSSEVIQLAGAHELKTQFKFVMENSVEEKRSEKVAVEEKVRKLQLLVSLSPASSEKMDEMDIPKELRQKIINTPITFMLEFDLSKDLGIGQKALGTPTDFGFRIISLENGKKIFGESNGKQNEEALNELNALTRQCAINNALNDFALKLAEGSKTDKHAWLEKCKKSLPFLADCNSIVGDKEWKKAEQLTKLLNFYSLGNSPDLAELESIRQALLLGNGKGLSTIILDVKVTKCVNTTVGIIKEAHGNRMSRQDIDKVTGVFNKLITSSGLDEENQRICQEQAKSFAIKMVYVHGGKVSIAEYALNAIQQIVRQIFGNEYTLPKELSDKLFQASPVEVGRVH
ncbi:hypothetical protein MIDIC_420015 [Alphaproteobacteria bacterium]